MQSLTNTWQQLELPSEGFSRTEFDMGCGKGRFTVELARRHPDTLVLCNDIISERLRIVERRALRAGVEKNLRALRATSLALVSYQLPPLCLDRLHLLCPDPWPKKKQLARRLVCTDFLCRVPRVLKKGGIFHLATDYTPYYEDWLRMFDQLTELYEPAPDGNDDMKDVKTDFELKWNAQGQEVHHICFRVK